MTNAAQTYAELFKLASASTEVQAVKKLAQAGQWGQALRNPRTWALAGLGGLSAAVPAFMIGKSNATSGAEAERLRTRNMAFGAGVASGLVAPPLLRTLGKATGLSLAPGGEGSDESEEYTSI